MNITCILELWANELRNPSHGLSSLRKKFEITKEGDKHIPFASLDGFVK